MSAGENTRPAASPVDDLMNARRFTGTMDIMRFLPNYYFSSDGRCRSPLRGLYGQSDGAGKACGRWSQSGASRRSTASARGETTVFFAGFSLRPASGPLCERMLSRGIAINLIGAWINAQFTWMAPERCRTGSGRPPAPILPQLNVIHCTDRRMAAI